MAKQQTGEVASLDPNDMIQGGLKSDFRATIVEAVYAPWDYDGNIEEPVLAARLTLEVEDEDEPYVQHWSAGDLKSFVPSEDGKTPCGPGEVGPYALRVGKRAQLNNNTNYAHLMGTILDSGEAAKGKPFTRADLTASLDCLVGLDAHWDRVPQKKRSGLQDAEGSNSRQRDVLVVTEVYGYGKPGGKAKAAPAKAAKAKTVPVEDEEVPEPADDDADLETLVVEALSENGDELKKTKLVGIVAKKAGADKRKAKWIKRVTEPEFLEGEDRPWQYDEDAGTITL